jgi:RNA polymerase sigma-70 factor (ECF subfamily)
MSRSQSLNFKKLVETFHSGLFRFAYCLVFDEQAACDLTQHTFFLYANKGAQLRDPTKLKPWLYATLYHEYKRQRAAPQLESRAAAGKDASATASDPITALDGESAAALFQRLPEALRGPLALFYLRELTYQEMAEVLEAPLPEVLERVGTGKAHLKKILFHGQPA